MFLVHYVGFGHDRRPSDGPSRPPLSGGVDNLNQTVPTNFKW